MGGALDLAEARMLEQLISFDEALERKNTEIDRLRGDMALMQVTSRTLLLNKSVLDFVGAVDFVSSMGSHFE